LTTAGANRISLGPNLWHTFDWAPLGRPRKARRPRRL